MSSPGVFSSSGSLRPRHVAQVSTFYILREREKKKISMEQQAMSEVQSKGVRNISVPSLSFSRKEESLVALVFIQGLTVIWDHPIGQSNITRSPPFALNLKWRAFGAVLAMRESRHQDCKLRRKDLRGNTIEHSFFELYLPTFPRPSKYFPESPLLQPQSPRKLKQRNTSP